MTLDRQVRGFGLYLFLCSIYQGGVYMRSNGIGSILDPRLGFFFLAREEAWLSRMDWASAIWLFCIGLALAFGAGSPLLVAYLVSECLLAFPTGLYIVVSLGGGAGHLTARVAPLAILLGLTVGFTIIPLALAVYLLWKRG